MKDNAQPMVKGPAERTVFFTNASGKGILIGVRDCLEQHGVISKNSCADHGQTFTLKLPEQMRVARFRSRDKTL